MTVRGASALAPVAPLGEDLWRPGLPLYEELRRGRRPRRVSAEDVESHQRQRMCGAMRKIIAEEGWLAASAVRVCELAGVHRTAFREIFGRRGIGRVECARAAVMEAGIEAFVSCPGDRDDGLHRAFTALVQALRDAQRYKPRGGRSDPETQKRSEQALMAAFAEALPHGPEAVPDAALSASFARALIDKLAACEGGACIPEIVGRALAGGIERAIRRTVAAGAPVADELAEELSAWVLCYQHPATARLAGAVSDAVHQRSVPSFASQSTKARILEAAAKVATSRGAAGLSLQQIARAAEVDLEIVANMYKTREECFFAAVERRGLYALVCSVSAAQNIPDALAGIRNAIEALMIAVANDPVLARLMFVELSAFRDGVKHREQLIARFTRHLRRALPDEATLSAKVSSLVADAVWALLDAQVRAQSTEALPDLAVHASYMVLAPAVGASQAVEVICARQSGIGPLG